MTSPTRAPGGDSPESGPSRAPRPGLPLALPPRQHNVSRRLYHYALRLYPAVFRRRFGDDLTSAFLDLLAEARVRSGARGMAVAWSKALADVVGEAAKEYLAPPSGVTESPPSALQGGPQMREQLVQDLRQALRAMRNAPAYTAAAVLTLALGIGANSAIFTVGRAALLQSAPVPHPQSLVAVWTTCRAGAPRCSSSYPDYLDYRERSTMLADLAGYDFPSASLASDDGARLVSVQASSGNYFELLGVPTALGRPFLPADEAERRLVAVLTDAFWRDQFGADPTVVGRTIRLNRARFEVIGVTSAGFNGLHLGDGPDLFIPLLTQTALDSESGVAEASDRFQDRGSRWIPQLVGRLAPGATVEQARAEMLAISDQLAAEDADARGPRMVTLESARRLIPPAGDDGELAGFVYLLGGVVGFTLLLACANLANLLLARAATRQREIGVRLALGASRTRVVRQLLTESAVLSLCGGVAGVLVGYWGLSLLAGYQLPGGVAIDRLGLSLDAGALGFTLGLSLLTGVVFGTAPALQATRVNLDAGMRSAGRGATAGASGLRSLLVAVQLALCLVLLSGAGLFLRALSNGLDTDLGFPLDGLAVASIDLGVLQYDAAQGRLFADTLVQRLEALPGVTAAGIGTRAPMLPGGTATMLQGVDGYQPGADEELRLEYAMVSDGYLRALGLPLLQGQAFDGNLAPGRRVLVVNREMAERWWPGRFAAGGSVTFFAPDDDPPSIGEIVGVVGNTKWDDGIVTPDYPFAYMPLSASNAWVSGRVVVLVRGDGDAAALLPELRAELAAVDPDASIITLATMETLLSDVLMPQRMGASLLTWFSLLTLALATVGIYSVVAYAVSQQRRELGIRIALGAARPAIVALVVGKMIAPLLAGLLIGVVLARLLAGTVASFLYGVSATDPGTVAVVGAGLALVAIVASLLPARRATRVPPTVALRAEA